MDTALLIKKVYFEGFRNLGHFILRHGLKIYFWITMALFGIVLYAFWFRIFTGFAWD